MPSIWVKDFNGGLDTRRLPETSMGGTLLRARNGHISRGGAFEQRQAFVPTYQLPAGTFGLHHDVSRITVFGTAPQPAGMPADVRYQQLLQVGTPLSINRIRSADMYRGKLYVVAEMDDGTILHFYDGEQVTDWYDGRGSARITIQNGEITPAATARATVIVREVVADPGNNVTSVAVGSTNLISAPIPYASTPVATAALLAAAITTGPSAYTAEASGAAVTVTAPPGAAANASVLVMTAVEDPSSPPAVQAQEFAGGADMITPSISNVIIGGVNATSGPVSWAGSAEATATALAAAISAYTSTPDYLATANGTSVTIRPVTAGAGPNGIAVTVYTQGTIQVTPTSTTIQGGRDVVGGYQAGTFVQTIGTKMYALSGSALHFSGIREPTKWTTDAIGAGFVDMSEETSGAEQLYAIERYQDQIAVFAERTIQTWFMDPDPTLNRQLQVLNNTGTSCPNSVTAFGDADIFYLDESGLRSLRARDSSNAAATADVGIPVDELVSQVLGAVPVTERDNIRGLIEPVSGRFWLAFKDRAFVFSYFPGSKISAWSEYIFEYTDENGDQITFAQDGITPFERRVYVRSGDTIFVYGGLEGDVHDETPAEGWLPYLDANDPTRRKQFTGIDAAVRGEWEVFAAMYISDEDAQDKVATIFSTTYDLNGRVPLSHTATHIALRFRSTGKGPHTLASCNIHFEGKEKAE